MAANIQQLSPTLPITALCFLPSAHISESILLAGEGCTCKIYSPATGQLLHTRRIFLRESINGIAFLENDNSTTTTTTTTTDLTATTKTITADGSEDEGDDDDDGGRNRRIVFWGGHRMLITTLEELISDSPHPSTTSSVNLDDGSGAIGGGGPGWAQQQQLQEIPVKDWVHYAFFIPRQSGPLVAVVTSHNQLLLYDAFARKWVGEVEMGEKCTIYSASGLFITPEEDGDVHGDGRIVVAAGTAFGDILVWSTPVVVDEVATSTGTLPGRKVGGRRRTADTESWTEVSEELDGWEELTKSAASLDSDDTGATRRKGGRKGRARNGVEVHYRLKGHEGSIFGVNISRSFEFRNADGGIVRKRYLASCSDDRTVRMWDVSRIDGDEEEEDSDDERDIDGQRLSTVWDKVGVDEFNTGFTQSSSNKNPDAEGGDNSGNKDCVAIGWGHMARIWNSRILSNLGRDGCVNLITTSEDLTSKVWRFEPLKPKLGELKVVESTHLHYGKNIFAMAVDETWGMLATGGHDSRIAVVAYGGVGVERVDWELSEILSHELEAVERSLGGLQITGCDRNASAPKNKKFVPDSFRNYAVLDKNRFLVSTNRGWLATYTFPLASGRSSRVDTPGQWRNLGKWDNLEGISVIAAWEGAGLIAVQDKTGLVGVIDLFTPDDLPGTAISERRGRWWRAGENNPGPMFCGRYGDLFYLLTTSLVDAEIRLHLFPDPRVSAPTVRNTNTPPPRTKTIILCPPPNFQSVSSYYLDFPNGLLFLGGRTGMLTVFDVWTGADVDIMLNPLDHWKGFHDKDAITSIIAYPSPTSSSSSSSATSSQTQAKYDTPHRFPQAPGFAAAMDAGKQRVSKIVTGGRNGSYAILEVSLAPATPRVKLTKLHIKKPLNGGIIEGLYYRGKDLITYGFRGKSFFVWNETRGYEVFSEDCGGSHRSWAFYKAGESGEESGVGWFIRTQAGRLCTVKTNRPVRRVLQQGHHGRETKALAVSPPSSDPYQPRLIATGAEDTLIRLSVFRPVKTEKGAVEKGLSGVSVFKKHTTGIQHLLWSDCGKYLFSSGGVEEFYVWKVSRLDTGSSGGGRNVGIVCEAACPAQSVVPDLRIMGFDVMSVGVGGAWSANEEDGSGSSAEVKPGGRAFLITMVYSDSSIKVWLFNPITKNFGLVIAGRYRSSCLLHVKHYVYRKVVNGGGNSSGAYSPSDIGGGGAGGVGYSSSYTPSSGQESKMLLFIAGTDGIVSVYDITAQLRKIGISILSDIGTAPSSILGGSLHVQNQSLLSPLLARQDLLTLPQPPTQKLPPPRDGWSQQIHQSSVKSMAIMGIDVGGSGSLRGSEVREETGAGERFSVLILTGGDDCAFAATAFTLSRGFVRGGVGRGSMNTTTVSGGAMAAQSHHSTGQHHLPHPHPHPHPHHSQNHYNSSSQLQYQHQLQQQQQQQAAAYHDPSSYPSAQPPTPTFLTKLFPEAHASGVTAIAPLWAGKPRWTGDGDDEPVKEVVVKVLTAGLDRVVAVWDVGVLVSAKVGGGGGGGGSEGVVVGVKVQEVVGARGYTPVADVAGAEVVCSSSSSSSLSSSLAGAGSVGGIGGGGVKLSGVYTQQGVRREEWTVGIVGVGFDFWDVKSA